MCAIVYCGNCLGYVSLQRTLGLLALVDEESRFPRATDHTLATKLHNTHDNGPQGVYKAPPDGGPSFGVAHYAGHVRPIIILECNSLPV